jgi:hypothetical protein
MIIETLYVLTIVALAIALVKSMVQIKTLHQQNEVLLEDIDLLIEQNYKNINQNSTN